MLWRDENKRKLTIEESIALKKKQLKYKNVKMHEREVCWTKQNKKL